MHAPLMTEALQTWLELPLYDQRISGAAPGTKIAGELRLLDGEAVSRSVFAKLMKVPPATFIRRLRSTNPFAPPPLGRPALWAPWEKQAIGDAAARLDDHGRGKSVKMLLASLGPVYPHLSLTQLKNQWYHHVRKHPDLITTAPDPAENLRRGAITENTQRHWFNCVDDMREQLKQLSTGTLEICDIGGNKRTVTYEDVQDHFVFGSDEESVQLYNSSGKIVGRRTRRRHLQDMGNARESATALRTGSAAGQRGPSVYVLKGVDTQNSFITTKWLEEHGAPKGSIYTENAKAYMTNETFDDIIERLCRGIRESDPIVKQCPLWWVEYHVDGFGAHVNTLKAQTVMAEYKIQAVQSESHSSHVNQAFDDLPAKESKSSQRQT
jgi:hypothetical protein